MMMQRWCYLLLLWCVLSVQNAMAFTAADCQAAAQSVSPPCNVPAGTMEAIFRTENPNGQTTPSQNTDGSLDYGCFQINDGWINGRFNPGEIGFPNLSAADLNNPQKASQVSAAILCYEIANAGGNFTQGVCAYNTGQGAAAAGACGQNYCGKVKGNFPPANADGAAGLTCDAIASSATIADGRNLNPTIDLSEEILPLVNIGNNLIVGISQVAGQIGEPLFQTFNGSIKTLLGAFAAIITLYHIFRMLMPFGAMEQGSRSINAIITTLGMVLLATALLDFTSIAWNGIYSQFPKATIEVSEIIRSAAGVSGSKSCPTRITAADPAGQSRELGEQLACQVTQATDYMANGFRIGWATIAAPTYNPAGAGGTSVASMSSLGSSVVSSPTKMLQRLILLISGVLLMLFYLYAIVVILFGIVDAVIRWTMLVIMSPFLIGAFAFKATRGFASFGFKGLFQSAFNILIIMMVVSVGAVLAENIVIGQDANGVNVEIANADDYVKQIQETSISDDTDFSPPTIFTPEFWPLALLPIMIGALAGPKTRGITTALIQAGFVMEAASSVREKLFGKEAFDATRTQTLNRGRDYSMNAYYKARGGATLLAQRKGVQPRPNNNDGGGDSRPREEEPDDEFDANEDGRDDDFN